jgi:hypothetical protein
VALCHVEPRVKELLPTLNGKHEIGGHEDAAAPSSTLCHPLIANRKLAVCH